jgi:phosphoribosyl-ATP pyrophosphohydrolase/phosphoribosyl-AMP cyclohydrolase
MEPAYDSSGLVPVIAQDHRTGEVLMFAYANAEAVALTRDTRELHLWSRSRQELWHKGATSGNVMKLVELRIDCDGDALLALVEPAGPACHTGERTCFYRAINGDEPTPTLAEALPGLERTLAARADNPPAGSYTARLFNDPTFAGAKVEEEAEEIVRAAREETDERIDNEAADLLYHLLVVMKIRGRTLGDAGRVLLDRRG